MLDKYRPLGLKALASAVLAASVALGFLVGGSAKAVPQPGLWVSVDRTQEINQPGKVQCVDRNPPSNPPCSGPEDSVYIPGAFPGEMVTAKWQCPTGYTGASFSTNLGTATSPPTAPAVDHYRFGPVSEGVGAKTATVTCTGGLTQLTYTSTTDVNCSYTGSPACPTFGNDTNTWDTTCDFSNLASVDPIVFPNQENMSHRHAFLGNRHVTSSPDAEATFAAGRADRDAGVFVCGDHGDMAAYWAESLWRCKVSTGECIELRPLGQIHIYYRGADKTVGFPVGFGMISNRGLDNGTGWACGDQKAISDAPTYTDTALGQCKIPGKVTLIAKFPRCWDGVHLTGGRDNTHMTTGVGPNQPCPPAYPVELPRLTVSGIDYGNVYPNDGQTYTWKLGPNPDGSFDQLPGDGTLAHADFWNVAWEPFRMDQNVHLCSRQKFDDFCHDDTRP